MIERSVIIRIRSVWLEVILHSGGATIELHDDDYPAGNLSISKRLLVCARDLNVVSDLIEGIIRKI